ncbi:glutamine synthetase [Actinomyces sp. zg-332]|uniref:glutamine synthetase family protein n=1 Tax=Actinomyces sp. zg-332 TaxID=2708340 RepID=UPI0014205875|nr:glutamine synthetase family protein [Actinomyces sp. zg-332]QPK94588.1 glutamine synthetase [Actinomyces sp. zg-332]
MNSQQEYVLRLVSERGVEAIRLWFTDVLGVLKSVTINTEELELAFEEGIGFDGSAIEGLTREFEADMVLFPDASTFQIMPAILEGDNSCVGRMFCDIYTPEGVIARSDPRAVLERILDKAKELGFDFYLHPEIEFYLFFKPNSTDDTLRPVDNLGYFDNTIRGIGQDFRLLATRALEEMGISVEFSHHEAGPGQFEIDLRVADALTTADNIMTFKQVVEQIASSQGMVATFMPKPICDIPGSGMHTHMSLFEGDKNAFHDSSSQYGLSKIARHFIAGILHYTSEFTAVTNQNVNSYKRLWGGGEAPSYICWAHNNPSALVRVPVHKPKKANSTRIEYRALDPSVNPYLAYAVILAAGIAGIEEKLELPPEMLEDVSLMSDDERKALGIESLPQSLHSAIRNMYSSVLVAQTLGEEVFDFFMRNKQAEWKEYRNQITRWELERFISF